MRLLICVCALLLMLAPLSAEGQKPVVIDGDSIRVGMIEWRLMGFDTPESGKRGNAKPRCEAERRLAVLAKKRLQQLVDQATTVELVDSGKLDKYERILGDLLVDGRNVKDVLIAECLARPYGGGFRNGWCWLAPMDSLPCQ